MEYPGPWLPEPLAEPNQESADLASSLTMAFLVVLEQLAPTERAVFLLREVFELDFDEIARSVGKSEANTRQILTRARGRLRDSRPRFTVSRRESEEIVRRFRHACVTGDVEELMAVLHADAELVADGGGKVAAATRPVLGADRIAKFVLGYAGKLHWSESDFQLVTINGAPGLLMRHPVGGNGTYSFDIADGRIRAIYVVRNPDKLRGLSRAHALSAPARPPAARALVGLRVRARVCRGHMMPAPPIERRRCLAACSSRRRTRCLPSLRA